MRDWAVSTFSPEQTRALGQLLGELVTAPIVILLAGDLGAGKTCFTQGLARGLAIPEDEPVTSPSYTLMNQYQGRLPLYHFDLYRLSSYEELEDLGFDEYAYGDGVTVVEWAERIPDLTLEGLYVRLNYVENENRDLEFHSQGEEGEQLLSRLAIYWKKRGGAE